VRTLGSKILPLEASKHGGSGWKTFGRKLFQSCGQKGGGGDKKEVTAKMPLKLFGWLKSGVQGLGRKRTGELRRIPSWRVVVRE